MNEYIPYSNEELMHYGVKGMKWGVRKDIRLLANRRRNEAVRKAKDDYAVGKITSNQKKAAIQKANTQKKAFIDKTTSDYKNATSQKNRNIMERDLKNQTINEVPNHRLKSGARTVNRILSGVQVGATAATAALMTAAIPALGPMYATTVIGTAIGAAGRTWLIDKGIDKLT